MASVASYAVKIDWNNDGAFNAWESPTGFNDPESKWVNEADAYDGDTDTSASTAGNPIPTSSWGEFIEFTHAEMSCSSLRFYARYHGLSGIYEIDLDVYYDGAWHDVYEGTFADKTWVEKALGDTYRVTKARMRFYNHSTSSAMSAYLYEFDFFGGEDDISGAVFNFKIDRGRDKAWELGRGRAAVAEILVDNVSKKYSPENSSSPIYGNIKPNRSVEIKATSGSTYSLFAGFIRDFRVDPAQNKRTVLFYCEDGMSRLRNQKIYTQVYEDILTGTAIGHVLDAAGWPAGKRSIDAGQTTMDFWWAWDEAALTAIRRLEETELGFAYIDEDGNFVFEDRHHKLKGAHLSSQATYYKDSRPYHNFRYDRRVRDVFNIASVDIAMYTKGSVAVLWTLDETPPLAPGETRTWRTAFAAAATDLVSPVATTDYTANSQEGGGGDNFTGDVAVVMTEYSKGSDIQVTNNGSQIAYITLLRQRGKLLASTSKSIEAENATSQVDYDKRSYPVPGAWIPNLNVGKDYCDYIVQRYGSEMPTVKLRIWNGAAGDLTEMLTRKVSDRVTIRNDELGLNADFFVEGVRHIVSDQGNLHVMELAAELASGEESYWVLGTSRLDAETKLAY